MQSHILIVDDDDRIRDLLSEYLEENNFHTSKAENAAKAREIIEYFVFDLIILDVMMPGEDGKDFARFVKQKYDTPILMLTALSDVENRILGLECGADDYLSKPFEPRELLLRLTKLIARFKNRQQKSSYIYFGDYMFDLNNQTLTKSGANIYLTDSERKLLAVLCDNEENKPISREELAEKCGGLNERSIDVQIIRLRTKIESDPKNPQFLRTIRGVGYVLQRLYSISY